MMLHEIFQRIITRLRRLQSQTRLGHRAKSRDQHGTARALRPSQNRLEKLQGAFAVVQLRLEPALEKALFFLVREGARAWSCRGCGARPPVSCFSSNNSTERSSARSFVCGSEKRSANTCSASSGRRSALKASACPRIALERNGEVLSAATCW